MEEFQKDPQDMQETEFSEFYTHLVHKYGKAQPPRLGLAQVVPELEEEEAKKEARPAEEGPDEVQEVTYVIPENYSSLDRYIRNKDRAKKAKEGKVTTNNNK